MKNFLTNVNDKDFGLSFFDSAFEDFFRPTLFGNFSNVMKTDVKNTENGYELAIEMAGYDKQDISLELNDGYITVSAKRSSVDENKNDYIKRERSVSCKRSYFVGDNVSEEDIKAKYENGVLSISVPKAKEKQIPNRKIQID